MSDTYSPTTNTTIVAGWSNPTYAYSSDNSRASTTTSGANQQYNVYGVTGSGTITKVEVGAEGYKSSSDWIDVLCTYDNGTHWLAAGTIVDTSETMYWFDVTSGTSWTWDKLSDTNFHTRIFYTFGGGCFIRGTKISTPEGLKNIELLRIGDMVIGDENGKQVFSRIKAKTQHLLELPVHYYKGIGFAGNHKVFEDGEWKEVWKLQLESKIEKGMIYNIETETQNFYINDLLVHNLSKT